MKKSFYSSNNLKKSFLSIFIFSCFSISSLLSQIGGNGSGDLLIEATNWVTEMVTAQGVSCMALEDDNLMVFWMKIYVAG